jgi:hypothetical protein
MNTNQDRRERSFFLRMKSLNWSTACRRYVSFKHAKLEWERIVL